MRPWHRVKNGRLGLKLGVQRPGPNWEGGGLAIGWALLGKVPRILDEGENRSLSDPVAELIRRYRKESAKRPGCEGVTLYRYGSRSAFAQSAPGREGSSHRKHNALIYGAKARLEAAGVPVKIEIIK